MIDSEPAFDSSVAAPVTTEERSRLHTRALEWVRKGRPEMPRDEQIAYADELVARLPKLREPKRSASESPLTMQERIARFIARIRDVPRTERMKLSGLAAQEKRELFEFYELLYVRSSLTDYRAAVASAYGDDHPAIKYLRLNKTAIADVNKVDRAQVRERQRALRPIDPEFLIQKGLDLISRRAYAEVAVGLIILTGRRPYEIFKVGVIEKLDETHVRFTGQAKIKNAPMPILTIPVLCEADRVIEAWHRLRSDVMPRFADLPDAKAVNRRTTGAMAAVTETERISDLYGERLTPKDLRATYAEMAYAIFGQARVSKNTFFHDVLGHAETDETSAQSYFKFYIEGHFGDTVVQNEIGLRNVAEKLYAERNALTDKRDIELRNARLREIESQLNFTSRASLRQSVGEPVDPAIADRAKHVRSLAEALTPSQDRLLRKIANGSEFSYTRERRSIDILQERGILEVRNINSLNVATLTDIGHEVRAELPDWEVSDDAFEALLQPI